MATVRMQENTLFMLQKNLARLGWPFIILITTIPVLMWLLMAPLPGRFSSAYFTLTSLGRIAGIIAVTLFCINIILTTRLQWLESLFGGLNKMYIAHHIIGGTALCIILIHPIFFSLRLAIYSAREAALFLLPHLSDITTAFGVLALWLFITLMIITFFLNLPYQLWLLTHKFLGLVLLLICLHVILGETDLTQSLALKAYLFTLLGLAAVAFTYRTLLPRFFVRRHRYSIQHVTSPAPGVVEISMQPKDKAMDYKSGQFLFVSLTGEGVSHEWHPFTISSNPKDKDVSITVKSLGKYTSNLVVMAPKMIGREVKLEGAYGRFMFRNFHAKRQIWIAGGIGITPFLSMVKDVTPEYKIDLYYSVKTESEMVDWQALQGQAESSQSSLRFIPIITEKDGFLTAEKVQKMSGDVTKCEVLVCGPPPMMKALREQFVTLGVRKLNIHTEEFAIT